MITLHPSPFGAQVEFDLKSGVDLVVVCVDPSTGHHPVRILLPHQVYAKDLEALFAQHGVQTITILQVRCSEKVEINQAELKERREHLAHSIR